MRFLLLLLLILPFGYSLLLNRRSAISTATTLLTVNPNPTLKTIVLTGSSSGIGFECLKTLLGEGHRVICPIRNPSRITSTTSALLQSNIPTTSFFPLTCDLTSQRSIVQFCDQIAKKKIDILSLNAGIARSIQATSPTFTLDGIEETIGVNHVAHFLLASLLLKQMNSDSGRIVVTASSVHDPASAGGKQGSPATLGDLSGLREKKSFEMVDGGKFDPDKAYKDSKLANVLFTQELAARLSNSNSKITVNCFSPGLIFSGLFREQNKAFIGAFGLVAKNVFHVADTVEFGGTALHHLMFAPSLTSVSGKFLTSNPGSSAKFSEFGSACQVTEVSKEANNNKKLQSELYDLTENLISSTPTPTTTTTTTLASKLTSVLTTVVLASMLFFVTPPPPAHAIMAIGEAERTCKAEGNCLEKGDIDGAIGYVWGASQRCDAIDGGILNSACSDGGISRSSDEQTTVASANSDSKIFTLLSMDVGFGPSRSEEISTVAIGLTKNDAYSDQVKQLFSERGFKTVQRGAVLGAEPVKLTGGMITEIKSGETITVGVKSQALAFGKKNGLRRVGDDFYPMGRGEKLKLKQKLDVKASKNTFGLVVVDKGGIGYGVGEKYSDDVAFAKAFKIITVNDYKLKKSDVVVGVVLSNGEMLKTISNLPLNKKLLGGFGGDTGEVFVGTRIIRSSVLIN